MQAQQYTQYAACARTHLLTQLIAALATVGLFAPLVSKWWLMGWLVLLTGTLLWGLRHNTRFAEADKYPVDQGDIVRHALATIANGTAWALPIFIFAAHAPEPARLELWTILAMLMTVSAVIIPAIPLTTLLFSGIVGLAMFIAFALGHNFEMASIAVLFVAIIMIGAVEASRNFLFSRLAEAGMAERNEVVSLLLREFEEGEADWLWHIDSGRRVRSVSPRFAFALGMEPATIDGQNFIQLIAGEGWESGQFHQSLHDLAERMKRRENFSNLLVRVDIKGQKRWWELSGKPKFDDNGSFEGFRGVGSDVTVQRESSDKIAWMARYDTLTGLPNRMMLTESLGDAMRYAEQWRSRCAFLMIDLDRFKSVNDTLGHHVGDQLLASVSERLKQLMTPNEICGRLGGDEFAVVIRDASDLARVDQVAREVIQRLSAPYSIDNHTLYVGASVGSAIGLRDGKTVETLMRNADLALYRAKDEGGGLHFTYEPGLHAQADERRKLEVSLRNALENKEFELHFQPVVDTYDERILSFEALIRWNSREFGMVSPMKFIPIAEDTRLIVPIGEWVLREACKQAMNWPPHIKVAVNVSGEQLLDPNFLSSVVSALSASGLPPQRLEIEVTESIFVRDATTARAALERVLALGCGVSLDDFGTGYSSLGYLRTLRFTTIKVDRSFVKGAATGNPESLAIIRAVVAMADSLEMSTVAEGVETEEELEMVRHHGCKKIQGYYFGRPMCAKDALVLFGPAGTSRTADVAVRRR